MFNKRIIGRLDIKSNLLIKGIRMEGWKKIGDPVDFAKKYYEFGIDELILLDVVASLYERNNLTGIISEIASEVFIPITVGGGIRCLKDVENLLKAGADKITLNTAAVKNPEIFKDISSNFGSQATVLAIECKRDISSKNWEPLTDNGRNHTHLDAISWAIKAEEMGAGEIFLTSIDHDGTKLGCDLELFKEISCKVKIPVIGGGGIGSIKDIENLLKSESVDAFAIGSALHFNDLTLKDIRKIFKDNGFDIRDI